MRPSSTAALALVAALIGGAAVLVVAKATGLIRGTSKTIVLPAPSVGDAGPVVVAKPLAGSGFQPAQIYRSRAAGVVTVIAFFGDPSAAGTSGGQGSGFVVSRSGTILTSAHVVTTAGEGTAAPKAARAVYAEFSDGDRVAARIVGYDLFDDVAVLRVDPGQHALDPVPLGHSDQAVVGEPVAALGSPLAFADSLTVGVVSAVHRAIPSYTSNYDLVDAIQTDAPINHGNSGGPLFDARGRVIGINAQIRSSGTSSGFEGIGFAVPIDSARRSLEQLLATGTVRYAYVGVKTEDLTPALARHFGYAARHGALVDSVVAGSGAARAGLVAGTRTAAFEGLGVRVGGDAIVAINGQPVTDAEDVVRIVANSLAPGESARFTLVRGSSRRTVLLRLGQRAAAG